MMKLSTNTLPENDIYDNMFLQQFNKCDVFTPDNISQIMSTLIHPHGTLLEPAVGTGNLLKYININNYTRVDIFEIKKQYLDVIADHPLQTKYLCDFLLHAFNPTQKYTNILLNPPYIRIQDLPTEYVSILKRDWPICKNGNIDIYYAFLLKCLHLLEDNGRMVAITPNSYLHTKSAKLFRKYVFENRYIMKIIDYTDTKVFADASVYCCITVFTKQPKDTILYTTSVDVEIPYSTLLTKSNTSYLLHCNTTVASRKLSDICRIYNGIATLRDAIFIHECALFPEEPCWRPIKTATAYKTAIYPYTDAGTILDDETFRIANPQTYAYLASVKDELSKRDGGNGSYSEWYAYGRTQSLCVSKRETVVYMPALIHPDNVRFTITPPTLHVGCLCIEPNEVNDIDLIVRTIRENMDYIKKNSSIKNNGWINISTTILKDLPI